MRWYAAVDLVLAYKIRLDAYGPDGAARQRDREEFEGDFAEEVGSSSA